MGHRKRSGPGQEITIDVWTPAVRRAEISETCLRLDLVENFWDWSGTLDA